MVTGQEMKEEGYDKITAGFCHSKSSCLLLKIEIIKVIGSVNNVFWIWNSKSTPAFKGGTFTSDT